jgi:SpoU rRNA methylase family enzyme
MIGLHNIASYQRLMDFSKAAFNFDIKYFVITKVSGTAAQTGIPDLSKIAFKQGKSFIVLPDLKDAIELLQPDSVYLLTNNSDKELHPDNIDTNKKILIVFSGIESGFTKVEQSLGETVRFPKIKSDIGPVASLGALLYCILDNSKT